MYDLTERDLYALMGEISIKFANLEFVVSRMLTGLIDRSDPVVGDIVTENMTLSQKLRLIVKLSRYRFKGNPGVDSAVRTMAAEIDSVRELRNTFTHGNWEIKRGVLLQGFRCCSRDLVDDSDEAERDWDSEELRQVSERVQSLLAKATLFMEKVTESAGAEETTNGGERHE